MTIVITIMTVITTIMVIVIETIITITTVAIEIKSTSKNLFSYLLPINLWPEHTLFGIFIPGVP